MTYRDRNFKHLVYKICTWSCFSVLLWEYKCAKNKCHSRLLPMLYQFKVMISSGVLIITGFSGGDKTMINGLTGNFEQRIESQ